MQGPEFCANPPVLGNSVLSDGLTHKAAGNQVINLREVGSFFAL